MVYTELRPEEAKTFAEWAEVADRDWPAGVPQDESTINTILSIIEVKQDQINHKTLSAALRDMQEIPATVVKFEQQTIPNLRNAQGQISRVNLNKLMACAFTEFGKNKKLTVEHLNFAVRLLASRGELTFESPLKNEYERTKKLESRDSKKRAADANSNARGEHTTETVLSASDKQAMALISKVYQSSTPKIQAAIREIVERHKRLGVPPTATAIEIGSYSYVQALLANPSGTNHVQFQDYRDSVQEVIDEEKAVEAADPSDSAMWQRVRSTLMQPTGKLARFSRGIR